MPQKKSIKRTLFISKVKPEEEEIEVEAKDFEPTLTLGKGKPVLYASPPYGLLGVLGIRDGEMSATVTLEELAKRWAEDEWSDEDMLAMIRGVEQVASNLRARYAKHKEPESPNPPPR
jgi:hypothetical protein